MNLPPKLWVFNYDFEFELARLPLQIKGRGDFLPWHFLNRFSSLLMPLCREDDFIVNYEAPNPTLLKILEEKLGYKVKFIKKLEPIESNSPLLHLLPTLPDDQSKGLSLQPWGWSPLAIKLEQQLQSKQIVPTVKTIKEINSKESSYLWRTRLLDESFQIPSSAIRVNESSSEYLSGGIEDFFQEHGEFYVKHFYGTSGKLTDKIDAPQVEEKKLKKYLQWIKSSGGLLFEKKLEYEREWSLHVDIKTKDSIQFIGITKLLSKGDGSYGGSIVRDEDVTLSQGLMKDLEPLFREISATNYLGPLGIDLLQTTEGEYKLLEVNSRWTMGRIALEWNKAINSYPLGLFIQESFSQSRFNRPNELLLFCQGLEKELGLEITVINFVAASGKSDKIWTTLFIGFYKEEESMHVVDLIKNSLL